MIQANATMPPPDALVADAHGNVMAAMFYFALGGYYREIAEMCGFECKMVELGEGHPLCNRYANGEDVIKEWEPIIPDGWTFGDKWDTEDGPTAIFIRRVEAPPA